MPPTETRERVTEPTFGEYQGHPTLTLPMPKARKDFTFGKAKAVAILANLDKIKELAAMKNGE